MSTKESNLTTITAADLSGSDKVRVLDGGASRNITVDDLLTYINSNVGTTDTWVPVITDGTNNATMTGASIGRYTKTGKHISLLATVGVSSLGSVSGALLISGLPFTSSALTAQGVVTVGQATGLAITASTNVTGLVSTNAATISLQLWDATTGTTAMQHTELSADGVLYIQASYYID